MLIDLLSMSNYAMFNIKIAHILGLHEAIYLSQLLAINNKAIRKNKIEDNHFSIDRTYLTEMTTLSEKEQLQIDEELLSLGILQKSSQDIILLNLNVLMNILSVADSDAIDNIKKTLYKKQNKTKRTSKEEAILQNLRSLVTCKNEELIKAYYEWIDAVYAKQHWMSAVSVKSAQTLVDNFSDHNLDVALKVIEIAAINGYRDMEWAINVYKKNYNIMYTNIIPMSNNQINLSEDVF